jgi:Ni/Co efflux regulator RcnB
MKTIQCLLAGVALFSASSLALAAPDQHDHDHHDRHQVSHRHDDHHSHGNDRDHHYYRPGPRYHGRPGYRHAHWSRGHRYYGPTYVVRNYGYYRLRPPPRGYHWIRADNDFLLVALTTGIILDVATH